MENLYNASRAAKRLGIHETLVTKYCRENHIKAIKLGNAWLMTEESLVADGRMITNLYSTKEAGERLGMTAIMVARHCEQGRIAAFRLGRAWLITEENLEAFERIPRRTPIRRRGKERKTYSLVGPNGTVFHFNNVRSFCREHGLAQGCTHMVLRGTRPHHKGWHRYEREN